MKKAEKEKKKEIEKQDIMENVKVRRWYENVEAKSIITAHVYLRSLRRWLGYLDSDPDALFDLVTNNFEEFKGKVSDQIRKLEREGMAGSSIGVSLRPLISYLKFYNVSVRLNLNIKNETRYLNAEKEIIPSQEQLASILRASDVRERVAISLMAFSGVRPEVLGSYEGNDGLKLGDIPELDISKLEFTRIPARVNVRAELSKIRRPYFTFLGGEGCKYFLEYLGERKRDGENLNQESAIISPNANMSRRVDANKFLRTNFLGRNIKGAIVKAGFNWRPYILRAYFGTNLDMAEAKGLISHPQRQFIMGHKGDIEATYTKRNSDTMIDEIREAYGKALKYLETEAKGISENDSVRILRESTINAISIYADIQLSEEERERLLGLSTDEFNEELRRLAKKSKVMELNNGNKNKIIAEKELESYLNRGWELVQIYPAGDRAIVRLPD